MHDSYMIFTNLIASISRRIHRLKVDAMAQFELKRSHLSCVYYIYREGSITPARLCTLCGEDKANVSRALKQLEDEGYVERAPRVTPRGRIHVTLTDRGAEIGAKLACEVDRIIDFVAGDISKEDISSMYRVLERIDARLSSLPAREGSN